MRYAIPHRIETERLVIRRYTQADAPALTEVITRNTDHLRSYMRWAVAEPLSQEARRDYLDRVTADFDDHEDYALGMFTHAGDLVGATGYHVRDDPARLALGYWVDATHQGTGLVTEACAALTHVGLELTGASIIEISHAPTNERSAAIPERLGFVRQTEPAHECFDHGRMTPGVMWWATWDHLRREPLSTYPCPRAFDARGLELPWK